jgi:predicted amidophosphoribosyltransferase
MPIGINKFQIQETVGKDYAPSNATRCCKCQAEIPRQDEYCSACYRLEVAGQKSTGMYAPQHTYTEVPPVPKAWVE